MKVKYKTSHYIGDCRRIDTPHEATVLELAFKSGGMYYFRQDRFNYLTISEDDLISYEN